MKPLLLLLLLVLTACGVRPSDPIEGGPPPIEELNDETVLYLLNGTTLTRVVRAPGRESPLDLLAEGPTNAEQTEGLTTQVPPNAAPITALRTADSVTVRISSALKDLSPQAQSQLVCTAIPPGRNRGSEVTLTDSTAKLPPQRCPFRP